MRAPLSWLREFTPVDAGAADIAATLSNLGLVVEGVERVGEGLGDILVARVLATRPHPKADRVQLVDIDAGDEDPLQVVCGAFNFAAGDLVPLAPIGATLPGGLTIARRQVRGEWSNGMLCSGRELGLTDDHEGILIVADGAAVPGQALTGALGLSADVVFDIDVTPNRPDCLSMAGVARELAAAYRLPFTMPEAPVPVPSPAGGAIVDPRLEVHSTDLCPRFTATVLDGVVVGPSPTWMANRLTLAGMRPINNVVDVSNYVMLERGQPNHAYDLEVLGGRGLIVRRARDGETLVTLDRIERRFTPDDCLICDADDQPVGIAGVMGGASSEISDRTSTVLLEAAVFDPLAVAATAKRLGLRTEASVRFEHGVDWEGVLPSVARFCALLGEAAGATVTGGPRDDNTGEPERGVLRLRPSRVDAILGTQLAPHTLQEVLEPLGFELRSDGFDGDDFEVGVPSWRPDAEREIDLIEEVARHHGYANVARTVPAIKGAGGLTPAQRDRRYVADVLAGAGLSEAWSNSFLSPADLEQAGLAPQAVEVENPLTADESLLRPSILPGLLRALQTNHAHGRSEVSLFEMGHVFLAPGEGQELPLEPDNLAVALGGRDASEAKRIWDLVAGVLRVEEVRVGQPQGDLPGLHPTRSARVCVGDEVVGTLGEIDPDVLASHDLPGPVGWLEVDLGALLACPRRADGYRPVSRYPAAEFDLAFVVEDQVQAASVEETLRAGGGEWLESVELFDVFRGSALGEGRRSLAYHLRFTAPDHTLSEQELYDLRRRCIQSVTSTLPATLR